MTRFAFGAKCGTPGSPRYLSIFSAAPRSRASSASSATEPSPTPAVERNARRESGWNGVMVVRSLPRDGFAQVQQCAAHGSPSRQLRGVRVLRQRGVADLQQVARGFWIGLVRGAVLLQQLQQYLRFGLVRRARGHLPERERN